MTMHMGSVPAGTTLYIPFATYGKTNGESITLTGLAVTDIEIYKNGSVTQRASDAGYALLDTDGIDFDGITGIHGFSIDLSDNTDAGFYAVGSWYWVVVSAVTIDSQTVNFIAATFRIAPAEGITGYPKVDVHAFAGAAATVASGRPEVNTSHIAGSAVSTSAAQIGVNVVQVSGDSVAADNLEAAADGTGYNLGGGSIVAASVTGAVGSVTGAVGSVTSGVTVTTNNDKTGYALSSAGIQAIWDALTSALTTAGSIGKRLVDNLDAAVSTRLASAAYTAPLDAAGVRAAVGLASANLDTQLTAIDDYLDTEVAAIKAKTDLIPASPAAVSDIPTAVQNADALLGRNVSGGSSTGRTVKQALHFLRNKWSIAGGTVTVYDTDDATTSWTASVTQTAGDPVSTVDPS